MKSADLGILGTLALFATFIWTRDLGWATSASDTLPILAALPLFAWLGSPWKFRGAGATPHRIRPRGLAVAAALFAIGIVSDLTWILAASWTVLLWSWLSVRIEPARHRALGKLLVLPLFAFPWVAIDFERVGWWFRISGAAAAERILAPFFTVAREGTFLTIDGFSASVEAACSGVNGLQSMLIAGTMLLYLTLKGSRLFWLNLPLLVAAAWLANLLRIVGSSAYGALLDPAVAMERVAAVHVYAGWAALAAMFLLCGLLFTAEEKFVLRRRQGRSVRRRHATRAIARLLPGRDSTDPFPQKPARNLPILETVILAYCAWNCRELPATWFAAPFDRLGAVAFLIWTLPLMLVAARGGLMLGAGRHRLWAAVAGLGLTVVGAIGHLNILQHAGLALVMVAFMPAPGRLFWAFTAISWVPALGWLASRLGWTPEAVGGVRILLAVAGAGWAIAMHRAAASTRAGGPDGGLLNSSTRSPHAGSNATAS